MAADVVNQIEAELVVLVAHSAPFAVDRLPGAVVRVYFRLALETEVRANGVTMIYLIGELVISPLKGQ